MEDLDEMEDLEKYALACDRAHTQLNAKVRDQIRMSTHHGDHLRLAALFVQCERATEQQTDAMQAGMASRVSPCPLLAPPLLPPSVAFYQPRPPLLAASVRAAITIFTLNNDLFRSSLPF